MPADRPSPSDAPHELSHCRFGDAYTADGWIAEAPVARREGRIDGFARALLLPRDVLAIRWRGGAAWRERRALG